MPPLARILPLALLIAALIGGCGSDESSHSTAPEQAQESGSEAPAAPVGVRVRVCKVGGEFALMRVTNVACGAGAKVASGWSGGSNCRPQPGQLRSACTVGKYRCLATTTGQGISVTCARRGRSIAFFARPG